MKNIEPTLIEDMKQVDSDLYILAFVIKSLAGHIEPRDDIARETLITIQQAMSAILKRRT